MSIPRITQEQQERHCRPIEDSTRREFCNGYVEQCVEQLITDKRDRDSSTFTLQSESGKSAERLDFDRCVGLTGFFSDNGKPKSRVSETGAESKPTDKRPKPRKTARLRKPRKARRRRIRYRCRMGFKKLAAMTKAELERYGTWKSRRCK